MNRELYEFHGETRLAAILRPGEVIIPDDLSSHKSPKAAATMSAVGAWFLVLPPYSPDLNPIEIIRTFTRTNGVHALTCAKLKALMRRAASRT
ncbi:transposase [Paracoccus rhizosphaerae]|uniref:Transposase n=1 Tax=Paracoccus rhizosphaerae TaxID=1133347 RepID=A0ABV6CGB1_9RHOB|nr:transposase [Paracoccus rhizosphaerae]